MAWASWLLFAERASGEQRLRIRCGGMFGDDGKPRASRVVVEGEGEGGVLWPY